MQSNIHAAFEEWLAATEPCEAPRAEDADLKFRRYGHALAVLEMESDYLVLCRIETEPPQRGKGHANRLLKLLTDICDRHQVTLLGQAGAYDNSGLAQAMLLAWYERHDFEVDESRTTQPPLVWYPRKP
ncbi:MAG TPA: N-acetyltransferase [Nitrococcus sp.]|nr:N-acetyltransferase [Nitrococcus sp.]